MNSSMPLANASENKSDRLYTFTEYEAIIAHHKILWYFSERRIPFPTEFLNQC